MTASICCRWRAIWASSDLKRERFEGLPLEPLRDQLVNQEQKFLRLEGRDGERKLLRRLGGPLRSL